MSTNKVEAIIRQSNYGIDNRFTEISIDENMNNTIKFESVETTNTDTETQEETKTFTINAIIKNTSDADIETETSLNLDLVHAQAVYKALGQHINQLTRNQKEYEESKESN